MPASYTIIGTDPQGVQYPLDVDDQTRIADVKATLGKEAGLGVSDDVTMSRNGNALDGFATVADAQLNRVTRFEFTSKAFASRTIQGDTSGSTTAAFVGYVVLSGVLLVLLFVLVSYTESAYRGAEGLFERLRSQKWRAERQPVIVELVIFGLVLLGFGSLLWALAATTHPNEAANRYGGSPTFPNTNDPANSHVPKDRHKGHTHKQTVIAILSVVGIFTLFGIVALLCKSERVRDGIDQLRHRLRHRNGSSAPASASTYDDFDDF